MTLSSLEGPFRNPRRVLSGRFAGFALALSLAYLTASLIEAPDIGAIARGMIYPLKLFLIALAPLVGGIGFLWSDSVISDFRRRRLMRLLLVLLWAFGSVAALSSL
jgi:hypothetical protein